MARFICVTSGKGGVGKTTIAINLATAFHKLGKDVLLVDGNLTTPNVHIHLGSEKLERSFYDVLEGKTHFSDAIHKHVSGLKVLPTEISIERLKDLKFDKLREAISDLQNYSEIVVIDSAASFGEEAISVIEASEEVLVVTNPERAAIEEARKTIKIAEELNKTILGVVINKKRNKKYELSEREIVEYLNRPIISSIPFDRSVRKALGKKHPVVHSHPRSKASKEFNNMALKLL